MKLSDDLTAIFGFSVWESLEKRRAGTGQVPCPFLIRVLPVIVSDRGILEKEKLVTVQSALATCRQH